MAQGRIKKYLLPGGESNPGLLRDRQGYSPLYYRGSVSPFEVMHCKINRLKRTKCIIPIPGIEPEPPGWKPGILATRPYGIWSSSNLLAIAYSSSFISNRDILNLFCNVLLTLPHFFKDMTFFEWWLHFYIIQNRKHHYATWASVAQLASAFGC